MNKKVPDITESVEELKSLMGQSTQVHHTTNGHWLSSYETGGLEKLLDRRYPLGRPSALTQEQRDTLRAELHQPQGFRSYTEIKQYISDTFGVAMKYKAVYALVHDKWQAKLKVPRKSRIKNAEASEAFASNFQQEVADAIDKKQSDYQSIRLFCQDETGYGLLPVSNRRIT